jgi:hypothetical protein
MMSHDELAIAIVALLVWGFGTAAMILDCNLRTELGRRWPADHILRGL